MSTYLRSLELLGIEQTLDDLGIGGEHVQVNTNLLTLDEGSLSSAADDIDRLARQNFGDFSGSSVSPRIDAMCCTIERRRLWTASS